MIVETKFFTVDAADVSGVGRNEQGGLYIVFKSGSTHNVKYDKQEECEADYQKVAEGIRRSRLSLEQ